MLTLRPYQQAAITAIYGYFQTHTGNPLVVIPTAGGKSLVMNPLFVEALMGWPTGWTGFASVATAWSRWLRRMRFELWRLNCWPMDEAAA